MRHDHSRWFFSHSHESYTMIQSRTHIGHIHLEAIWAISVQSLKKRQSLVWQSLAEVCTNDSSYQPLHISIAFDPVWATQLIRMKTHESSALSSWTHNHVIQPSYKLNPMIQNPWIKAYEHDLIQALQLIYIIAYK